MTGRMGGLPVAASGGQLRRSRAGGGGGRVGPRRGREPHQSAARLLARAAHSQVVRGVVVALPAEWMRSPLLLRRHLGALAALPGGDLLIGVRWNGRTLLGPAWQGIRGSATACPY